MKYMCLVYHEEAALAALSQTQLNGLVSSCTKWVEDLERGGHHVFSAGLQSVRTAKTVRHRNGKLSITDGPFAETKEFLGGFTIIEAKDLDEALTLAGKFPSARLGSMEVRPLMGPDKELVDDLDRKLASAILRTAPTVDPAAAAKIASLPPASGDPV